MIKAAVIGVGDMGKNHVRVYQQIPGVELIGVVDTNKETAEAIAKVYRVPAYQDYFEMLADGKPDAVSVAVPTQFHYAISRDLLEAGCHVLVEKPIAATLEEAQKLNRIAGRVDRVLMVGHIERFNPAIIELKRLLDAGKLGRVFQIHARRIGPFPTRIKDVGVVIDLATHDLDIMRYLTGSDGLRVYAQAGRELHTSHEDLLNGIIDFTNGVVGVLEINWLTPTKIRELYVTGEYGMFFANYITQELSFFENAAVKEKDEWSAMSLFRGVSEGSMTRFAIQKREPLRVELETFINSVRGELECPANGYDAQAALMLALALIESANLGQVKEVVKP